MKLSEHNTSLPITENALFKSFELIMAANLWIFALLHAALTFTSNCVLFVYMFMLLEFNKAFLCKTSEEGLA